MRHVTLLMLLTVQSFILRAQILPGFKTSGSFDEQQLVIENSPPGTRILINAPIKGFDKNDEELSVRFIPVQTERQRYNYLEHSIAQKN